jgi:hypothetical protein
LPCCNRLACSSEAGRQQHRCQAAKCLHKQSSCAVLAGGQAVVTDALETDCITATSLCKACISLSAQSHQLL